MKRWLAFHLAVLVLLIVHERMHAIMTMLSGEYEAFRARPMGFEVTLRAAAGERSGI